jgi:hypothetical protein
MKKVILMTALTVVLSWQQLAFAKFGVQLPFLDGHYYECTQNSEDGPTALS